MGALLYSTIPTIGALIWGISRKLKKTKEDERNGTIVGKPKQK